MPIFDKDEAKILVAMGIGAAALALLRGASPAFVGAGRPLAKAAMKSGILLFDWAREAFARASENAEDLMAEVRSEMAIQQEMQAKTLTIPQVKRRAK
jgi:hypothetical protein